MSRNLLFSREQRFVGYMKLNSHNAINGQLGVIAALDRIRSGLLATWGSAKYAIAHSQLPQLTSIKETFKYLKLLYLQRSDPVLYELHMSKTWTHTLYCRTSETRTVLSAAKWSYWRNIRDGDDCVIQFEVLRIMADQLLNGDIYREVRALIRSIHILQATRISQNHDYQKYPSELPEPVLPDFVRTALKKHRAKYGKDSIF